MRHKRYDDRRDDRAPAVEPPSGPKATTGVHVPNRGSGG